MSYFEWTGNPFVDSGISVLLNWADKVHPKEISLDDVKDVSTSLNRIYFQDAWKKSIFSIFANSPITNPSIKDKKKRYKDFLFELINDFKELSIKGDCIACGRRNVTLQRNRMDIPLTGYAGSHFFSYKTEGADYCSVCAFAIQCIPLSLYRCGNLALIHSNSIKVMNYWAKKCIDKVREQIASKNYTGCFNENFKNAQNALFHITKDLIIEYYENWTEENASIRIYHFTNYNQGANLNIYDLPSQIFRFLAYIKSRGFSESWNKVVRKGYRYKIGNKSEDEYKNYPNQVYQQILSGQSILKYFIDFSQKLVIGDWNLITTYLLEVRKMDQQRIDTIKKVADEISETIHNSSNGKKRLNSLEQADNYAWFRNSLLKIMKDRIKAGKEQPLFTFDEYVEQLFPEGALGWRETQDLILFRLYEKLHPWFLKEGLVVEEEDQEEELSKESN